MKTADLRRALDPRRSAVVAACAGSGKTWLLTARVLRLLVEGASPGSILAFTYTRAAAAEIRVRVAEGAQRLARADDSDLRALLAELQIESPAAETLAAARKIHRRLLLAQPGLEISTMHGWFLELIKSRPWEEGRVGPPRLRVGGDAALIRRLAWRDFCAAPPPEVGEIFAAGFETESLREWMFAFLSRRVARRIMDDWSRREGGAPSIPESIVDWRLAARAFLRAAPTTGGKKFTIGRAQIESRARREQSDRGVGGGFHGGGDAAQRSRKTGGGRIACARRIASGARGGAVVSGGDGGGRLFRAFIRAAQSGARRDRLRRHRISRLAGGGFRFARVGDCRQNGSPLPSFGRRRVSRRESGAMGDCAPLAARLSWQRARAVGFRGGRQKAGDLRFSRRRQPLARLRRRFFARLLPRRANRRKHKPPLRAFVVAGCRSRVFARGEKGRC